jgi:hypothetical protein
LATPGRRVNAFFRRRTLLLASVHRLSQYSKYHRPDQNQLNSNQFSIQIINMPTSTSLRHLGAGAAVRYGQYVGHLIG